MAEVLLTHAVSEAEEAIESGNYGGAIAACQRILGQFPEFAGAHRIMAEAYAEQGDMESAKYAYHRTLERDPQSIPAHLGLGMMAEDAGDRESALAYFQVAWEIDPRRRDLREHVSRTSQQLYGSDGRLYLTRAALASLHFHAGRWDRAVSEAAQVLQEYSSRIDVQVRLAEALWRRGDDEQARQVCRTVLRSLPSAVVPLLMLADIHRREGDHSTANDLLKRARDIDPDGVRAADLIMIGLDDQADFLAVDAIPTIDDQVVHEEPARYAPAPDFTASEPEDAPFGDHSREDASTDQSAAGPPEQIDLDISSVRPFSWDDITDEDLEASDLPDSSNEPIAESPFSSEFSLPSDEELDQARPGDDRERGYTEMLDSLGSEGMEPFDPSGGSATHHPAPADSESDEWLTDASLPTDEELDQARPGDERERGYTEMLDSLGSEGMEPFDPLGGETGSESVRPDELSQGSDELLSDLSDLSMPTDQELEEARPADEHPRGFTGMLSSLEDEGVQPFDPTGPTSVEEPARESGDQSADSSNDMPFDLDWSRIDEEIEDAIPGEMPSGYTDELRDLDVDGFEPFAFDESGAGEPDAGLAADAEEPELAEEEPPAGEDELDLDSLAAGWDLSDKQAEDDAGVDEDPFDSIDVVFAGEVTEQFADTEPLRADVAEDFSDDAEDVDHEVEASEPAADNWPLDDGFDELIAAAESVGSEWPASDVDAGEDTLLSDAVREFEQFDEGERAAAPIEVGPSAVVSSGISAERLGLDEALIERAREAKRQLIEQGVITGSRPLPGTDAQVPTGAIDDMRSAVENDPFDIDNRIGLASALVEEHPDEALEHFRWVYRNAPDRGPEVMADLVRLIVVMREREVGVHRLLGALYRRHGDWLAAATHYEESLTGKLRRSGE